MSLFPVCFRDSAALSLDYQTKGIHYELGFRNIFKRLSDCNDAGHEGCTEGESRKQVSFGAPVPPWLNSLTTAKHRCKENEGSGNRGLQLF
jgi:hypothetical protein